MFESKMVKLIRLFFLLLSAPTMVSLIKVHNDDLNIGEYSITRIMNIRYIEQKSPAAKI